MPARKATASGKWSQSIWDVTPGVGDDVFANGFTVEIDQNINVGSLRTTVSGVYAAAGGGFTLYQPLSVIASPNGFLAGSTTCLTSFVSAGTATLSGRIVAGTSTGAFGLYHLSDGELRLFGNITGGSANQAKGFINQGNGTLTIFGNISGTSSFDCWGGNNISNGNVVVTGNVYGPTQNNASQYGILNSGAGLLKITGDVYAGGTRSDVYGILNSSAGTVIVIGNLYGGNVSPAVQQSSTGTVLVTGTITASTNAHGVVSSNTAARNEFTGTLVNSVSGRQAVYCARYLVHPKMFDNSIVQAVDRSGTYVTYYSPEAYSTSYVPHVSSVAVGTAYAAVSSLSGVAVNIPVQLSGTMVVPSEASVSFGTLVGQTTGTAIHNSEQLQQVWSTNINTLTAANSLGARLRNTATVQEVGQQIQNLNF